MEKLFNTNTPVIFFDPNVEFHFSKRSWVLWPMIAYKVIVPYPKEKQLNIFQETILKLCDIGMTDSSKIADKMKLKIELIDFIIEQLEQMKLLNNRELNERAKQLLSENNNLYDIKSGYVFKDAIGDFFWDYFANDLPYINAESGNRYRKFYWGDIGSGKYNRSAVIWPKDYNYKIMEPDSLSILKSCIKHKIRANNLSRAGLINSYNDNSQLPANLEKVKYTNNASPILVVTYIASPEDGKSQTYWQAANPFGYGISTQLKTEIENIIDLPNYQHLKEKIHNLSDSIFENDLVDMKSLLKEADKKYCKKIENIFSSKILDYHNIFLRLIDFYKYHKETQNKSSYKNYEKAKQNIENFVDSAYKVIEESLYTLCIKYDSYFSFAGLSNSFENSKILKSIAIEKCDFFDDDKNPFMKNLLMVKTGTIKYATDSKDLKGLLASNLLIANNFTGHPFHKIALKIPYFFRMFNNLRLLRNRSDHASENNVEFEEINKLFPTILLAVSLLIDNLTFNEEEVFNKKSINVVVSIKQKIYQKAKLNIEKEFGLVIRKFDKLNKYLNQVEFNKILTENENNDKVKGSLIVELGKLAEQLLLEIKPIIFDRDFVTIVGNNKQNILEFEGIIKESEFLIPNFPDSFTRMHPSKVKGCFNEFSKGTLGAKLFCLVFCCVDNNKILQKIAKLDNHFIDTIISIADLRKHGNKEATSVEYFNHIQRIYNSTKAIINIVNEEIENDE